MNRFNYFFRQKVTEAELDGAFDAVEAALKNWALDNGVVGITSGAAVSENAGTPNLTVDVSGPASIYDQLGSRVTWTAQQDVDCSVDENSNSTAVITPGNEKYLSIFAEYVQAQADARLDGNGDTVYFQLTDSFQINVVQGAEAAAGLATPPALRADQILLADILLDYGATQILNADISTTRREWAFKTSGISPTDIGVGTAEAAIQALAERIDSANDASGVAYAGGAAWHDGTTNPATNVEAQLDKLITDLNIDTGQGGADKLGSGAIHIAPFPDGTDVSAGSIYDQLETLRSEILLNRFLTVLAATHDWGRTIDAAGGGGNDCKAIIWDPDNEAYLLFADTGSAAKSLLGPSDTGSFTNGGAFAGSGLDTVNDAVYNSGGDLSVCVGAISAAAGAGIQTSPDAGVNWTARSAPASFLGAGAELFSVAGTGSVVVAVGVDNGGNGGAIRSGNNGVTWSAAASLPSACTTLRSIATDGSTWIAVGDNSSAGRIYRSTDPSVAWTDVTPGGGIAQANSVAYDSEHDCWVVVTDDEIFYSDDGGLTWNDVSPDATNKVGVAVLNETGLGVWVAASATGYLYVTYNLGTDWFVAWPTVERDAAGGGPGLIDVAAYGHMLRSVNGRLYRMGDGDLWFSNRFMNSWTRP